jgi:hypothetical protein
VTAQGVHGISDDNTLIAGQSVPEFYGVRLEPIRTPPRKANRTMSAVRIAAAS